MDSDKLLWNKCADFHGHVCPGLTIGYKAALYASEILDLTFSKDEDVVCISENDACGVDAIQVILGSSVGKGNLLFHITGKQAFSIYNRKTGRSVRLVLKKNLPMGKDKDETYNIFQNLEPKEMFDLKETRLKLPKRAQLFEKRVCEECGEEAGTNWMRLKGKKIVCKDCAEKYDRFNV